MIWAKNLCIIIDLFAVIFSCAKLFIVEHCQCVYVLCKVIDQIYGTREFPHIVGNILHLFLEKGLKSLSSFVSKASSPLFLV